MIRIVLDDEQFSALVRGKVVTVRGRGTAADPQDVEIMLADIGFERMDELLWQAEQAAE